LNNWYSLGLTPINKLIENYRQLDLESLLIAVADGQEKLYQLIPGGYSVDIRPQKDELIDVSGLFADSLSDDIQARSSRAWIASPASQNGPLAVQLCPQGASKLAQEALLKLTVENTYQALLVEGWGLYDGLVDEDGTALALAEVRTDIYERIGALKKAGEDWKGITSIDGKDTYLDYAYLSVPVGELAITRDCLQRNLGKSEHTAGQRNSKSDRSAPLKHPAKDPDHPKYAPELHAALEAWEALYLHDEKPAHVDHTTATDAWLNDHWPTLGPTARKKRIAPVINLKDNKNLGRFEEKQR